MEETAVKVDAIALLVDLLLATAARSELYRDVASVYAPKMISSLLLLQQQQEADFMVCHML